RRCLAACRRSGPAAPRPPGHGVTRLLVRRRKCVALKASTLCNRDAIEKQTWRYLQSASGAEMPTNTKKDTPKNSRESRRNLLAGAGGGAFSFMIVPRHVLGGPGQTPPSERVNLAGIGAGGMGGGDIATFKKLGANIVALCDVDDERAAGSFNASPSA